MKIITSIELQRSYRNQKCVSMQDSFNDRLSNNVKM